MPHVEVPSMTDVMQPKFVLSTKRGWGMVITAVTTAIPVVNLFGASKGIHIDGPMVALVGQSVGAALDAIGVACGVMLWVWGSFKPTAPLTLFPGSR